MLKWLRRKRDRPQQPTALQVELQLEAWEAEAASTPTPSCKARIFNRAADYCAGVDRRDAALAYFGRALDAYLDAGALDPATAVCRKILRHAPDAVRVHCTIACILIQDRNFDQAREEIQLYVEGARRLRTESLAISRLRLIAAGVADPEMKRFIAAQLRELGDAVASRRIEETARGGSDDPENPLLIHDSGQWEKLLVAATLEPDDLWKHK
jgi:hypothetical protein